MSLNFEQRCEQRISNLPPEVQDFYREIVETYQHSACNWNDDDFRVVELCCAAALRYVADTITPEDYTSFTGHVEYDQGLEARNDSVRDSILFISTELGNL